MEPEQYEKIKDACVKASAHLDRSERGRQAKQDLLALLEHGGLGLDSSNQTALEVLVLSAWSHPSTVLSLLRGEIV